MAQVGCPDRPAGSTLLCTACCSPSQLSHHAMVLGAISSDPQRGWIIISLAPSHHCPGHSGELVGKRDGGDFGLTVVPATLRPRGRYLVPWILA